MYVSGRILRHFVEIPDITRLRSRFRGKRMLWALRTLKAPLLILSSVLNPEVEIMRSPHTRRETIEAGNSGHIVVLSFLDYMNRQHPTGRVRHHIATWTLSGKLEAVLHSFNENLKP